MQSGKIFGVILDNIFYSNRMEKKLRGLYDNGIYSIDMTSDNFLDTIEPADIDEARKFFNKASRIKLIRGISFHDGMIPENPVKYKKLPIKVSDPTYDDFQEIEIVEVRGKACFFLRPLMTNRSYVLMDLAEALEAKKYDISSMKDLTPEMRVAFTFHVLEKRKKEMEEPVKAIKVIMSECGATVDSVKKTNYGYEVRWHFGRNHINTLLDKDFRVAEAGFCVSGYDRTQSAKSVVNLLQDYVEEGSYIHKTRV